MKDFKNVKKSCDNELRQKAHLHMIPFLPLSTMLIYIMALFEFRIRVYGIGTLSKKFSSSTPPQTMLTQFQWYNKKRKCVIPFRN